MKFLKSLKPLNYLYNVLVLVVIFSFVGMPLAYIAPAAAVLALVSGTILNAVVMPQGAAFMAVQKEIWENDIMEQIFKDNSFVRLSYRADDFVNGRAVHIPQSGGAGNVVRNRSFSSTGATVRKRTDTDVIYLIDEYTTDPVVITNAETVELSYDKRNSVIGEDKNAMSQLVAEEMIYNWLNDFTTGSAVPIPAGRIKYTTGASIAATAPGATGHRKAATLTDLQTAATFLRTENQWFEGQMNALFPASMQAQMFPVGDIVTATYMQATSEEERRKGLIARVQGFGVMQRSSVVIVSSAGVIKAPGAAAAAGDCEAVLIWYTNAVECAYGTTQMFERPSDPQFFGDLYSFLVRMGGRARRANFEGIVLLVQAFID